MTGDSLHVCNRGMVANMQQMPTGINQQEKTKPQIDNVIVMFLFLFCFFLIRTGKYVLVLHFSMLYWMKNHTQYIVVKWLL